MTRACFQYEAPASKLMYTVEPSIMISSFILGTSGQDDQTINNEFTTAANSYFEGTIASVADAEDAFVAAVQDAGIV